jgi:pyruvate formate lyase activating enzyme
VLPFHQLGRAKWADLDLDYALADSRTPTPDEVEAARAIFRFRGLPTY